MSLCNTDTQVVEEIHSKIKDRCRHWYTIDNDVNFLKMPASRSNKELGSFRIQSVFLSLLIELQFFLVQLNECSLSTDLIHPGWSESIFKISHEHVSTAVHRIDAHFRVRWTSNLNPSALNILRWRGNFPVTISDVLSLLGEGQRCTTLYKQCLFFSLKKKCFSSRIELSLESSNEFETLRSEKLSCKLVFLNYNDSLEGLIGTRHDCGYNYMCYC